MGKKAIVTREKVFEGANIIFSRGERPMANDIKREVFDGKGSLQTIQGYLWEWREEYEKEQTPASLPELPPELVDLVTVGLRRAVGSITEKANQRVMEVQKLGDQKIKELTDELRTFVSETKRLETDLGEKESDFEKLRSELNEAKINLASRNERTNLLDQNLQDERMKAERLEKSLEQQREKTESLKQELAASKAQFTEVQSERDRLNEQCKTLMENMTEKTPKTAVKKRSSSTKR